LVFSEERKSRRLSGLALLATVLKRKNSSTEELLNKNKQTRYIIRPSAKENYSIVNVTPIIYYKYPACQDRKR